MTIYFVAIKDIIFVSTRSNVCHTLKRNPIQI